MVLNSSNIDMHNTVVIFELNTDTKKTFSILR